MLIVLFFVSITSNAQSSETTIVTSIQKGQDFNRIDSIAKAHNYKGGDQIRVFAFFRVTEEGEITDLIAHGPSKAFEDEAIKIIKAMPKLDSDT